MSSLLVNFIYLFVYIVISLTIISSQFSGATDSNFYLTVRIITISFMWIFSIFSVL